MKHNAIIAILGLFHAPFCPAADTGRAKFINQDVLHGNVTSLENNELIWQSPMLAEPGRFPFKSLLEIEYPASGRDADLVRNASVKLTNGDMIRGKLLAASDESLSVETAFGGVLNLNRPMVESVMIEVEARSLYAGPASLDGWVQPESDKPAWSYQNRSLVSSGRGSIGRDGLLPEECSLGFDVAWKGESIDLRVCLFSDAPAEPDSNAGYELSLQRGSIYLRVAGNRRFIEGAAMVTELRENDRARIELRASRKSGKVCLLVDGALINIWQDDQLADTKFGDALKFNTHSPHPTRLSNIVVIPWDGEIDEVPQPRGRGMRNFGDFLEGDPEPEKAAEAKSDDGRMQLANGDSIDGEVLEMKDGNIRIKSSLGEVTLPISRLKKLALKKVGLERAIRRNGDVRASFPDGSTIVFRLDRIADGALVGSSQNFGEAMIRSDAISRIEFNIYDAKLEALRTGDAW